MAPRVRYAPSPTGRLHVGNVRTALFVYLLARAAGGTYVLRVEDTDRRRYDPDALADIYDNLTWLGLRWDEGPGVGGPYAPYIQSERVAGHRAVAERLVATGHAYRCYCDPARLERVRATHNGYDRHCRNLSPEERRRREAGGAASVIRFRVPLEGSTRYDDLLLGAIERRNSDINPDPVLLKSDGFPTYHLAAIADDHDMAISHVLRAQEWVSSAPLHLLIFRVCGWQPPHYAHLPAVNGPDGKKLGKRHGATGVHEFRRRGILPEALVNYLALLGWSPGDDREFFTLGELEHSFSMERLGRAGAVFDHKKLEWFNGHYIRRLPPARLAVALRPYLREAGIEVATLDADPASAGQAGAGEAGADATAAETALAALLQERITVLDEAPRRAAFLGPDADLAAEELVPRRLTAAAAATILQQASPLLEPIPATDGELALEERLRELARVQGVKFGDLMMTIRMATTGSRVSPPLFGSLRLLGEQRLRGRLARALATLTAAAEED
ncbi:MAG: glutamate--tRNA ligase [Spirochaetaceae bacterium]|nr:glutamate--tRNA ligase [Spirochaetaceae bacterium]